MAQNQPPPGLYFRFDPNRIPPVLGGPHPLDQSTSLPNSSKRPRGYVHQFAAPSIQFPDFEKALQRAAENEHKYTMRPSGEGKLPNRASSSKKLKTYHEPAAKDQVRSFVGRDQMIQALRDAFNEGPDVNFAGTYRLHEPGVSHQQRIKNLTHEIWNATGYRFTIKDHPRTKDGHKTRLWCSQDEAHKLKPSKSSQRPRTLNDNAVQAKARYPCRSGLLISSREEGEVGTSLVTVRMHHRLAHEPYYDNTLTPEMTQSLWANISREKNSKFPLSLESDRSESGSENAKDKISRFLSPSQSADSGSQGSGLMSMKDRHAQALLTKEMYQQRMRQHISAIRDFCDGLEYQLLFNDFRMLEVLESEGGQFLQLVQDCLEKEGRLKADTEGGLPTNYRGEGRESGSLDSSKAG